MDLGLRGGGAEQRVAHQAVGTGTQGCRGSPGLWSQPIQGGPPTGGKTRARAGPQTWAPPLASPGHQPGQEPEAGPVRGGMGPSRSSFRNARSQAPWSTLRAYLLFFPFLRYNYRLISSRQAISDLHRRLCKTRSQRTKRQLYKDKQSILKEVCVRRVSCSASLLHKAYLKAAHTLAARNSRLGGSERGVNRPIESGRSSGALTAQQPPWAHGDHELLHPPALHSRVMLSSSPHLPVQAAATLR